MLQPTGILRRLFHSLSGLLQRLAGVKTLRFHYSQRLVPSVVPVVVAAVMDDADILSEVLRKLVTVCGPSEWLPNFASVACVSRGFLAAARHNAIWQAAAKNRWEGQLDRDLWIEEAQAAGKWMEHYRMRERPTESKG